MITALIPWRPGCPHRERALAWVRSQLPWESRLAEDLAPETGWSKGAAIAAAANACDPGTILIVHDADVWTDGIHNAVAAVQDGATWAVPHRGVFRLTEAATSAAVTNRPTNVHDLELAERPYLGIIGGGIVVIPRELLLACPIDPRFIGWGGEDEAWGLALRTMLGPPVRIKQPLTHLWHPPQPRVSRRRGSDANTRLLRRYVNAADNPDAMARLLAEAQRDLRTAQHPVHDHAPLR